MLAQRAADNAPGSQPVRHSALWKARLRKMTAQHLRLCVGQTVLTYLENLGNLRMQLLPPAPKEHSVRDILHERMLEICMSREAGHRGQTGGRPLSGGRVQIAD